MITFRKATVSDIDAIADIYDEIHTEIELGKANTGWIRGVYPTRKTAEASVMLGDMFVMEIGGKIIAAARINKQQVDVYADVNWKYKAEDENVMVIHTLVVTPAEKGKGYGTKFVDFYERFAKENGCSALRMDTNEKNLAARALYKKLGYREAGIVPCTFNGISGVGLVCLEKKI